MGGESGGEKVGCPCAFVNTPTYHGVCYFHVGAYLNRVSSTLLPTIYIPYNFRYSSSRWDDILRGLTWTRDLPTPIAILGPIKINPTYCGR